MTVFVVALLAILVAALLEVTTTDIQIMQNHVNSVEAQMTAMAGLNDAFAQLRLDSEWEEGFTNKAFDGGTYSVDVNGSGEIMSIGTSKRGISARIVTEVTTSAQGPPYTIRQNSLKINP